MQKCSLGFVWRRQALMFGLLATLSSAAKADVWANNVGLYNGGPSPINPNSTIVEIKFTGNSGVWVYGDAQTASNFTSNGSSIPLYCIDLNHDSNVGSSYRLTAWTNPNSYSASTLNKVAWAMENAGSAGYGPAAAQLLIWSFLDANFQVINWNNENALLSAYSNLVGKMAVRYDANASYMGYAVFYNAIHQPQINMNQDFGLAVPEPSSVVIAGLGAAGLIGYRWRRRGRIRT
jgi:hypothetical protein